MCIFNKRHLMFFFYFLHILFILQSIIFILETLICKFKLNTGEIKKKEMLEKLSYIGILQKWQVTF